MLETPEGGIFESNAIARYVARLAPSGLLGSSEVEAVRRLWPRDACLVRWAAPLTDPNPPGGGCG